MADDMKLVSQGAEGRVLSCNWLGRDAIVKQRFPKRYRHPDLDLHITRERLKGEARSLVRCKMIGVNVPALYDVNIHSNELIIEHIRHSVPVRTFIKQRNMDCSVLVDLAKEIGEMVFKLHSNDMIHGDLTTSNMLVTSPSQLQKVYLIDFGLSYVSEQVEDKAVDLYVLERAILSTHPNSEEFMANIIQSYERVGKKATNVLHRLKDVRQRGRKKLCFG